MPIDSLMQLVLALLGILIVLVLAVVVVVARMPKLLARWRPPVEKPRRVIDEPTKTSLAQARQKAADLKAEAAQVREEARAEAEKTRLDAERLRVEAREILAVQSEALARQKAALADREAELAERETSLREELRESGLQRRELDLLSAEIDARRQEVARAEATLGAELERVAGISADEARSELMARVENEARLHATALARDIEHDARAQAELKARTIITGAIQRLAADQTAESVVATVALPAEDMKGRIIGREGRNIRAFEQVTGVNVLIDDTPESVTLSCFDPVRREVARLTLEELVQDGRIQPARIEEAHARNTEKVRELCVRAAEDALAEMGITDLHPELVPVLGALRYRTSYGQNVLKHLVECGHLAAIMASELGLDVAICRRAAFLHDLGKALTHESEGSHARVGADLARRYGEHPDVVHAIEAHHNEVEPRTAEAVLTQAADAISGSRPGARRDNLEAYVKRLERLEQIASDHAGVEKVFAMQAGREVRVMVAPDAVTDAEAHVLARDIARQVESELTYPGQIRITVVRESRATELAH